MPPPVSVFLGREVQVSSHDVEKLGSSLQQQDGALLKDVSPIKSDTADDSELEFKDSEQQFQPAQSVMVKQTHNRRLQIKGKEATRRSTRIRSVSAMPAASPQLERGYKPRQKQRGARAKRKAAPVQSAPPARSSREWEIEAIVESCIEADTFTHYYFVKWKGFSSKFNTWEPKINLKNCPAVLKAYEKRSKKT
ncbi:hypothetical protein CDD81_4510 [Ophiocordyceps australis]|uniref:Chromo domain-containing protein n=1 Tax=Ophiocordyceps australis TaxID=1399860 RepID=A0A2C5YC78_9HYPO|nr:hypothetical protein CDD81_4510 [Ophiocordyceps australis]